MANEKERTEGELRTVHQAREGPRGPRGVRRKSSSREGFRKKKRTYWEVVKGEASLKWKRAELEKTVPETSSRNSSQ